MIPRNILMINTPQIIQTFTAVHSTATAYGSAVYTAEGTLAGPFTNVISDGSATHRWSSLGDNANYIGSFIGQDFGSTKRAIRKVDFRMWRWSNQLDIMVGDTASNLTLLMRLDFSTATSFIDDNGNRLFNPYSNPSSTKYNELTLPNYTPRRYLVFRCPIYSGGYASDGGGTINGFNARLGLYKMRCFV